MVTHYSAAEESKRILDFLLDAFPSDDNYSLPAQIRRRRDNVSFKAHKDLPYFPIPFKETETAAALKAIEASVAAALRDIKTGTTNSRAVTIDLEKTTAFLFQAYLATVGGLGKLDPEVKKLLKGTFIPPRKPVVTDGIS
jgi:hypothetical protein